MYCIYCGKLIDDYVPAVSISDKSIYQKAAQYIQKIYKDFGIQTILTKIIINEYDLNYYFKFLPIENKNILSLSDKIIDLFNIDGINIRLSNEVVNLLIITIPFKIHKDKTLVLPMPEDLKNKSEC